MTWILTHSGRRVDLAAPDPAMIAIEDIAHALAHQCRFVGHAPHGFSVAEHSLNVARTVAAEKAYLALPALLHDAGEAYYGDVSRPLKFAMRARNQDYASHFDVVAEGVDRAIAVRFQLSELSKADQGLIAEVDGRMLATELGKLFGAAGEKAAAECGFEPYDDPSYFGFMSPPHATASFLDAFARAAYPDRSLR